MKKIYLIFKILLILVALIAVAYLVTPPDSEIILKRPWLEEAGNTDYDISKKVYPGEIWEIYKGDRKVLWIQNEPGFLVSTAILPPGAELVKHPFINAKALDPLEEDNLQKLLSQSQSFEEFLFLLSGNDYILKSKGTPLVIKDGTQGQYGDDLRIGVGNIRTGEYEIGGVKEIGIMATLWVSVRDKSGENKTVTVYIGQSFEIDKYVVTVTDIHGDLVSLRIQEISE